MESLSNLKIVQILPPQLKNNGDFAGNTYVDTSGAAEALFLFNVGTTDAAVGSTDEATPPLIEECDTSGGSYTAVTGAALAAVLGTTDDNKLFGIRVNLRKPHKRYMRVKTPHAASATGANLSITCILGQIGQSSMDAAGMGLSALIEA
jgi:hypothetical protein